MDDNSRDSMQLDPPETVAGEPPHQDPPSQTPADEPMSQVPTDNTGSSASTHDAGASSSSTAGPSGDPAQPTTTNALSDADPNSTDTASPAVTSLTIASTPASSTLTETDGPILEAYRKEMLKEQKARKSSKGGVELLATWPKLQEWPQYGENGKFDVWEPTLGNADQPSPVNMTPAAATAYLDTLGKLSVIYKEHKRETTVDGQITKFKIANCVYDMLNTNDDLKAVWQFHEFAATRLNSIVDRIGYDKTNLSSLLKSPGHSEAIKILGEIEGR